MTTDSFTITDGQSSATVKLRLAADGKSVSLIVDGEDYPVLLDIERGRLRMLVWHHPRTDGPDDS